MFKPLIEKCNSMRIVLASSSKQRQLILANTPLKFEVCPSNYEENLKREDYSFTDFVEQTAYGKACDVYERLKNDSVKPDIIIAVDTMVTHNGRMYGKPKNDEDAVATIKKLTQSGIPNAVYTGVVILFKGEVVKFTEVTTVYMNRITDEEIKDYVASGEPNGKAGSYGIQGIAATFVQRIEGDHNNVIGLPLYKLTEKLKELVLC